MTVHGIRACVRSARPRPTFRDARTLAICVTCCWRSSRADIPAICATCYWRSSRSDIHELRGRGMLCSVAFCFFLFCPRSISCVLAFIGIHSHDRLPYSKPELIRTTRTFRACASLLAQFVDVGIFAQSNPAGGAVPPGGLRLRHQHVRAAHQGHREGFQATAERGGHALLLARPHDAVARGERARIAHNRKRLCKRLYNSSSRDAGHG